MSLRFVVNHALRESRASWRRLGLYMSSITLGVAALVAINSFRASAVASVDREARALLGADLRLSSNREFPEPVELLLDSAATAHEVARVTSLVSMAAAAATLGTRLVQLRAVESGYPFYGTIETEPRGEWTRLQQGGRAIVDPAVLNELGVVAGDTLLIGEKAFVIAASLKKSP
ncbi:MAG: ABC transporter permease, partial [Gemmatimonadota bacterium]